MEALLNEISYLLVKRHTVALLGGGNHRGEHLPGVSPLSGFVTAAYLAVYDGGTQTSLGGVVGSRYLFMNRTDFYDLSKRINIIFVIFLIVFHYSKYAQDQFVSHSINH